MISFSLMKPWGCRRRWRHSTEMRPAAQNRQPSLFATAPLLDALDLTEAEIADLFGGELREVEREDGRILSFFTGTNRHVVLKAKELSVLRPHAQILRTGDRLVPDEAALTSNTWMGGVFHAMVTQGHVSINRFLSTTHSYLGLFRGNGLRLFVEGVDGWHLLDVPSAFEMTPESSRWIYKHPAGLIEVQQRRAHRPTRIDALGEGFVRRPCPLSFVQPRGPERRRRERCCARPIYAG